MLYTMLSMNCIQFILCTRVFILLLTHDLILSDIVAFPIVHPPAYLWTLFQTFYFNFLPTFLATSLSCHSPTWIPALPSSAWHKLYSCLRQSISPQRLLPNSSFIFPKGWLLLLLVNKQEHVWETGLSVNNIKYICHAQQPTVI